MNLSDNLKKIRKEHNLSQEDLAEKLNVSRQSVSKWEQGLAYPEMDKVLQICKMFNLKLDDLLNNDIKKVEKEKSKKININKYIDDFLSYITKTIDMFINMKLKDRLKCVLEQLIIIFVLSILLKIFGGLMNDILRNILFFLSNKSYDICYQIFFALYSILSIIIILVIVLHIFKVRYLDYYEVVDNEKSESKEEKEKLNTVKNEKVIIRDPNHSGDKFISGLFKILLIVIKVFMFWFACLLCFTFIGLVACFVISFMFVKTGAFFIGIILCILASLIINYVFLDLIYHFYINTKPKFNILGIMFLCSLISIGIGCGLLVSSIPEFKIIDTNDNKYYTETEKTYELTDGMQINNYYYNLKYVETDNDSIVIKCTHPKIYDVSFAVHDNKYINVERNIDNEMDIVKQTLKDINNKTIVNYDNIKITVYTSKENIEKLKENKEKEHLSEYEKLEQEIQQKDTEISNLQDRINKLEER